MNIAITLTAAQADSMQRVVVRTITNLLGELCDADCLHFCALAAKNLTVLDNVKAYLDDQVAGIAIDILARLRPGSDDTVILCTGTLFNCVGFKQSRVRATDKNIVAECQRVIGICGADAQHSCTVLLAELSKHSDVAYRLLEAGIMETFSSNLSASDPRSGEGGFFIGEDPPKYRAMFSNLFVPTYRRYVCVVLSSNPRSPPSPVAISAAGLSNLAADPDNHWRVLESDDMLKMLLRALVLDHLLAQHHILHILCDLVSNESAQAEVVSAGIVRAVQDMGNRDMHASAISLILFNISCNTSLSGRYAHLSYFLRRHRRRA